MIVSKFNDPVKACVVSISRAVSAFRIFGLSTYGANAQITIHNIYIGTDVQLGGIRRSGVLTVLLARGSKSRIAAKRKDNVCD